MKDSITGAWCFLRLIWVFAVFFLILSSERVLADNKDSPKDEGKVTINFVDVDIETLVKFISDNIGENFLYDERLKGKVTIIAPTALNKSEIFDLFTSVLALKGFATVHTGDLYKIIPSAMVKQDSVSIVKAGDEIVRVNEGYIARLIPLEHASANELIPTLKPLVSNDGYLSTFGQSNALLVLDTVLNIDKILKIVEFVDVEAPIHTPEIVFLKYAQADTMVDILKEGVAGAQMGGQPRKGMPMPQQMPDVVRFVPDARLNAVLIFGTPEDVGIYKKLISLLDVPSMAETSRIHVYYLENAKAEDIAKVLTGMGTDVQGAGGSPPPPTSGIGQEPLGKPVSSKVKKVASDIVNKFTVTPDPATNALIIMASPEDFKTIKGVIEMLDLRPRQVFVEATIMEVSVNDALALGAKWRASITNNDKVIAVTGVGNIPASDVASILTSMSGFSIGRVGNPLKASGYAALFSMSEFKGIVDVLSTPQILTSDNQEAEIVVGENVPFRSKVEGADTANQTRLQSVERKDIGITLRIKPQVSEGDYVKLDIYQEISAIAPTQTDIDAVDLITTKRSAKTTIVVKNNQTVVIGGLIQDKKIETEDGMPFLSNIPFLGWLFKSRDTQKQKTNLLVYLTPTIVSDFDGLDNIREKKQGQVKEGIEIGMEKKEP
ncbi:MAG: type II secretion system secretin GspD [Deltaproteobacteria bacterium]|nr:type II secretion system secretin GspD [Deltaproteobacteria bacterium]